MMYGTPFYVIIIYRSYKLFLVHPIYSENAGYGTIGQVCKMNKCLVRILLSCASEFRRSTEYRHALLRIHTYLYNVSQKVVLLKVFAILSLTVNLYNGKLS